MATTSIDFNKLKTTQKGILGQDIVKAHLEALGYVVYLPATNGKAHPFDNLVASPDKKNIFVVEVKSKPKRIYYPDTGIDVRHFNDYQNVATKYNMEVYIYFVDEDSKTIYGGTLTELTRHVEDTIKGKLLTWPLTHNGIIYFHISTTTKIADLDDEDAEELRKRSTRSADYLVATPDDDSNNEQLKMF